jgi:alpha-tubulin suppressor-like RCC1 family protein
MSLRYLAHCAIVGALASLAAGCRTRGIGQIDGGSVPSRSKPSSATGAVPSADAGQNIGEIKQPLALSSSKSNPLSAPAPRNAAGGPERLAFVSGVLCGIWKDGSVQCMEGGTKPEDRARVTYRQKQPTRRIFASNAGLCLMLENGEMAFRDLGNPSTSLCRKDLEGSGDWVDAASSVYWLCGVKRNGSVWCYDALGPTEKNTSLLDIKPQKVLTNVKAITTAGGEFFCALKENGSVWCWGRNDCGNLGNGTNQPSKVPVRVRLPRPARTVSAGQCHVCALLDDHNVACWGHHLFGQLGIGRLPPSGEGDAEATRRNPTRYPVPQILHFEQALVSLSTGIDYTCVLTRDGAVLCWGHNWDGTLFKQDAPLRVASPMRATGLGVVKDLVVDGATNCVLNTDSRTLCWGGGNYILPASSGIPVELHWD